MEEQRIRKASAADARRALAAADECFVDARSARDAERWHAAGVAAIQVGIAAADAVLAAVSHVRSASPDHQHVVRLLGDMDVPFPATQRRQIQGLLSERNAVYYEHRALTAVEARVLVDQCERFLGWAHGVVDHRL